MKIAVVIPCFNVELFCEKVIEETLPFTDHIVLVDDGSNDGTGKILHRLHLKYPGRIHLIQFPSNQGKGFALVEGFRYSLENLNIDAIITIDADGQHQPTTIPLMVELIQQGADFAIGQRTFRKMPFYSQIANFFMGSILRLLYFKSPWDNQSGLRALSKNFAKEIVEKIQGGRYEMEFRCILLALKEKKKIQLFPIETIYWKKNVHSHFRKIKDSLLVLKILLIHLITLGKI